MGDTAQDELPVRWEQAGRSALSTDGAAPEDSTMSGIVRAHIETHSDQSIDVHPIDCPAADMHHSGQARCLTIMFDGERRSCPYWQACTMPSNDTHRADPSTLAREMFMRTATQMRCGVICQRARANRPPGC